MSGPFHLIYTPAASNWNSEIGQSHNLWRADSLFVVRVASFVPERSEGASNATRDTNKLLMPSKSHVVIIIINTQGQIVQIYFIR